MKIRTVLPVAGVAAAMLGFGLLTGSAFAAAPDPAADARASAEKLLASYASTNEQLAACMKGKGYTFNAAVTKTDVADAFSAIPESSLTAELRQDIDARIAAAPEDPNEAAFGKLAPLQQAAWANALNSCSSNVEDEANGGDAGMEKLREREQAARNSPEVKAAAKVYQRCMANAGFTVDIDPNVVPKAVAEAEHSATAAAIKLADRYHETWHSCVTVWQDAYDKKLYG